MYPTLSFYGSLDVCLYKDEGCIRLDLVFFRFQKQLLLQLESLLNGYTRPGVRLHQIHVMLMPTAKDAEVLDFHQPSPQV